MKNKNKTFGTFEITSEGFLRLISDSNELVTQDEAYLRGMNYVSKEDVHKDIGQFVILPIYQSNYNYRNNIMTYEN